MSETFIKNLEQFNEKLHKFANEVAPEAVTIVQKKLTFDVFSGVVKKTPVDTGRARGAWQITVGQIPSGEPTTSIVGPRGGAAAGGQAALSGLAPYQVIYISNNVPYIGVLENGGFIPPDPGPSKDKRKGRKGKILVKGGYSVQAPKGMMKLTLVEISTVFL